MISAFHHPPRESRMSDTLTEENRARLLALVNNDWSPYRGQVVERGVKGDERVRDDYASWDFGLLRHDIHVLLHAASKETAQ